MTKEELIQQAKRISQSANRNINSALVEAKEFLRNYAGKDSSFFSAVNQLRYDPNFPKGITPLVISILDSFIHYVENDLLRSISLEREIQIDTVSDYLEQAETLLNDSKIHPGAPAVIIGASLEEFLRNCLEDEEVDLSSIKNNLDAYSKELRSKELITKQDMKDLTSWGGIRNDAAHGRWEEVNDKSKVKIMLEGINLFMRKYS